jgi:hypothetical protein
MQNELALKPSQAIELLLKTLPLGIRVLLKGEPGVGKTSIYQHVCDTLGWELMTDIASQKEPTDIIGLPDTGGKYAVFKPFSNAGRALDATKPLLWLWDDVAQSVEMMQNAIMHVFETHSIGDRKLPDVVRLGATTNERDQKAGVRGLTTPFKARFHTIVRVVPDLEESCQWLAAHGASPMMIGYLKTCPDALCEFEATQDLVNFPSPRSWFKLSQLEAAQLSDDVEAAAFAGCIGAARAQGYRTWKSMSFSRINLDAIIAKPDTAAIPTAPDQLYAIAAGLSRRAEVGNFAKIATYLQRLIDGGRYAEFAVLCVNDATRRDAKLKRTGTFATLQSGPVGKLFTGQ